MSKLSEYLPAILTVSILGMVFLEWGLLLLSRKSKRNKEGIVNIVSAGFAFFPIFILQKLVLVGFMYWLYEYRWFQFEVQWYHWLVLWIIYDFGFWLIHFLGHRVRLLWCIHGVHHQPHEMKLSVGFRGSFLDFVKIPHNIIWLPLLGFNPLMILLVDAVGKMYGVLVHINENWLSTRRWKRFEWLLVSPSLHRAHHSTNHIYLDRNFGEAFSVWDRIFRTLQPYNESDKLNYGVMKEIDSENLVDSQLHELKSLWEDVYSTSSITDKLKYIFYPPGWNHINGGVMADDLRMKAKETRRLSAST